MADPKAENVSPLPPRLATRFSRRRPLQGRAVLVRNYSGASGLITVSIAKKMDVAQFWCKIAGSAVNAQVPASLTGAAGLFQLADLGANIFQNANVTVNNIDSASSGTTLFVGIGAYDAAGNLVESETFDFIAVRQSSVASVQAKSCLFFAYSSTTAAPPFPDESIAANRPYSAPVPLDATSVAISVPQAGNLEQSWTHSGGNGGVPVSVHAPGQSGDADDTVGGYVSDALNSKPIVPVTSANDPDPSHRFEGMLYAMWDYGLKTTGVPVATSILPVGQTLTGNASLEMPKPNAAGLPALSLLFGSHQESHWGRAQGSLNVTVVWS